MNEVAGEDKLFVCLQCGKWSKTLSGNTKHVSRGWDESCIMNAVEVPLEDLTFSDDGNTAIEVRGGPEVEAALQERQATLARIQADIDRLRQEIRSGDVHELDPELLELAKQVVEGQKK